MGMQFSVAVRNARLDAFEDAVGSGARLCIMSGQKPANCGAPKTGTLLCEIALPAGWLAKASGGTKKKSGTWSGEGIAEGEAGYFRVLDSGGVCHQQGTITKTGGGGDMMLEETKVYVGQTVTVGSYSIIDGNA